MLGDLEDVLRKQGFALGWMLSGSRVSFMIEYVNKSQRRRKKLKQAESCNW